MPAASWPRCCSACRPSAVIAAASGCPMTPKTPHSSRSRSLSMSKASEGSKASVGSLIGFPDISVDRGCAFDLHLIHGRIHRPAKCTAALGWTILRLGIVVARPLQSLQYCVLRVIWQHRHQPIPRRLEDDFGFGVRNPGRLGSRRHKPGEEQKCDDHDNQPASETEQKAKGAIERTNATVQDHIRKFYGDDRNDDQCE